ncbi:MAG TPA: autotransporter outer membrane beta-barrel domain-containing protein [Alphaproteobacteria bacterium]|nr:autotransporter outer membrane beta-barrel domain-containing protein [Alphaproteobacteria bacterium]
MRSEERRRALVDRESREPHVVASSAPTIAAFGPTGSFELYDVSVDGFTESGAGAFNIKADEQETTMTVARLGIHAESEFLTNTGTVMPYGHLGYASRSSDDAIIPTSFGGVLPGITPVDRADDSWVDLGLGVSVETSRQGTSSTRVGVDYRGAVGDNYENHSGRLFVEFRF